jgi:hypothetical protein
MEVLTILKYSPIMGPEVKLNKPFKFNLMSKQTRRKFTSEFKAQVALEASKN